MSLICNTTYHQAFNPLCQVPALYPCLDMLTPNNTSTLFSLSQVALCLFQSFILNQETTLQRVQEKLVRILPTNASDPLFSQIQDCSLEENCADLQTLSSQKAQHLSSLFWGSNKGNSQPSAVNEHSIPQDCTATGSERCQSIDPSRVHQRAKDAAETIYLRERFTNWASSFYAPPEFTLSLIHI